MALEPSHRHPNVLEFRRLLHEKELTEQTPYGSAVDRPATRCFPLRDQPASLAGDITRLRKTLADDARIVALRQSVREAAESKLRNGIIDTNDLLQKITDEAAALSAQSVHEIELLKALYELKHTINQ